MSPPLQQLLQSCLDTGEPVHDVIVVLRRETTGNIAFLKQLRALTGCSLDSAVSLMVHLDNGRRIPGRGWPLLREYVRAERIPSWSLRIWARNALLEARPYLLITASDGGGMHLTSSRTQPTAPGPRGGSSTVALATLREELHALGPDPRVQVVEDTQDQLVLFFPPAAPRSGANSPPVGEEHPSSGPPEH